MTEEFNWNEDPCVVIRRQPATAVYTNDYGQAVIRQEREWNEECDMFVAISAEHLVSVIYGLIDTIGAPYQLVERVGNGFADVERPSRNNTADDLGDDFEDDQQPQLALPAPDGQQQRVAAE